MSTLGVERSMLQSGSRDWSGLADLMTETSRDLSGAPTGGLAPSVQGAASGFLTAWSGYAGESAAIATDFSRALDYAADEFTRTDNEVDGRFSDLDGRLGPAR